MLLAACGVATSVTAPAAAEEPLPTASGKLVELKRATALDQILASEGVLLLDCFADW